ncbi:MauE/DoxX family redox-associated membrane protein, partial [Streptomyces sp. NPDC048002]|uniref:DoxX family protein n=1 Tax=Streptomyces sp. NPDC048002 TaxID=3154344 RepID=UPI0033CA2708
MGSTTARTPDRAADPSADPSADRSALQLAGLLAAAGAAHFVLPKPFDAMVPRVLPGSPRTWTRLSGAAEVAVAAALAVPRTRRAGGWLAAGLFLAVLPANVQMAMDWRHRSPALRTAAWARVPLQVPLVVRRVARRLPVRPSGPAAHPGQ